MAPQDKVIIRRDKAIKFMRQARFVAAEFSKDPSTKVGALLLAQDDYSILAQGYNGMPRGLLETPERWERPLKYRFVRHAERNAIDNAARKGVALEGCVCVVTMMPCADCAGSLAQIGCKAVVTMKPDLSCERWGEHFATTIELFGELGIELIYLEEAEVANPA